MPWDNQKEDKDNSKTGGSPWEKRPEQSKKEREKKRNTDSGSRSDGFERGSMPSGGIGVNDIDALLRKGQKQMRQMGGGASVCVVAALAFLFWLFHCFYIVQQNEQAVEMRFGKPKQTVSTEGLHFYLWPIEYYSKVPLTEQTVTIGRSAGDGLMLSGDQNIVNVNFSVYYYITQPTAYLFNVRDQGGTVKQVAESAMREVVGRRPADDVYRNKREAVAAEVHKIIQSTLDKYGLGVNVGRVSIREAAPPSEVAAAFNAVQQAEQERNRAIEQGNQKRANLQGLANGQAAVIREKAAAYRARIVEEARGEAQRFASVEKEAKTAPEITRFRLYVETMEQLLSAPGKLAIGTGGVQGSGVVPYLPLDTMLLRQSNGNGEEGQAAGASQPAARSGGVGNQSRLPPREDNNAMQIGRYSAYPAAGVR